VTTEQWVGVVLVALGEPWEGGRLEAVVKLLLNRIPEDALNALNASLGIYRRTLLDLALEMEDFKLFDHFLSYNDGTFNVDDVEGNDDETLLMRACRKDNLAGVRLLLLRRSDADFATKINRRTCLHIAAKHAGPAIVTLLLEHGARIKAQNSHGWTPFHVAVWSNRMDVVKVFLQHVGSPDFGLPHERGPHVLWCAMMSNSTDMVELLLPFYTNVGSDNYSLAPGLFDHKCDWKYVKLDVLRLLLEAGADPNPSSASPKLSPLRGACKAGRHDIAHTLVEYGAVPAGVAGGEMSLLKLVLRHPASGPTRLEWLLTTPAITYKTREGGPGFFWRNQMAFAIERGNFKVFKHLLPLGGSHLTGDDKQHLVQVAVRHSRVETAQYLLENGVIAESDVAAIDGCLARNYEMLKFLHDHGADMNARDDDGFTALHYAVRAEQKSSVRFLLRHGAKTNISDKNNKTPEDLIDAMPRLKRASRIKKLFDKHRKERWT
jgi:ankyrin repeat protein